MTNKVQIKLKRSLIGSTKDQIKVVKALGLSKTNQVVEHEESPVIMGMVKKVSHLLEIVK
ncbi:50S ribosomal protein L30 [bacterium]|nr:50S ribosomal protein L30 [bacterium]